jgi:predicted esterase
MLSLLVAQPGHCLFSKAAGYELIGLRSGRTIRLFYAKPEKMSADTQVLFVCHGVKRNPQKYLEVWQKYQKDLNVILVAPEFSKKEFPKGRDYNQGNLVAADGSLNPAKQWSLSAIDEAFLILKMCLGLTSNEYLIYGHSAGAQFVHRLAIFLPETSAGVLVAANPGSLTFLGSPASYPYGLPAGIDEEQIKKALRRKLILLAGLEDIDPDHKHLNNSSSAKKQGANRLERGRNFFEDARKIAQKLNAEFNWQRIEVPGVAHSNKGMASAAAEIFLNFMRQKKALKY